VGSNTWRRLLALAGLIVAIAWLPGCGTGVGAEGGPRESEARQSAGTGGINQPAVESRAHVVLVSFDGFHPGYLDRFETPHFDRLAARGTRATGLVSVFPSLTFPAHYSIATGLHPEAHGIVGNRFFDPLREAEFSYRRRGDAQDGSWWGGEPIWVTAETQGLVSAAFFFPGTEADIGGVRPSHWRPYDGRVRNRERIEQVLAWLSLPAAERPHLVTLYFSLVDGAGHRLGPGHPDMRDSVESADGLLGRLMDGLDALPHADRVALVVVSDHGMAAPDPEAITVLSDVADLRGVRLVAAGPAVGLHVDDPEHARTLRDRLNARLVHARAYLREELPEHLHARDNPRLGDLLVMPTGLGMVQFDPDDSPPAGMHGWDPTLPEMHGIFLAAGPGIAAGITLPAVNAVDVYPLLAHLLGLTPPPDIAGDLGRFAPALQHQRTDRRRLTPARQPRPASCRPGVVDRRLRSPARPREGPARFYDEDSRPSRPPCHALIASPISCGRSSWTKCSPGPISTSVRLRTWSRHQATSSLRRMAPGRACSSSFGTEETPSQREYSATRAATSAGSPSTGISLGQRQTGRRAAGSMNGSR
jgi:predicted AlkP superfamily pyrophosphatase or phosphodiesterase